MQYIPQEQFAYAPQEQLMYIPQEQYPVQYMAEPQVYAAPYGCGSCKSAKFGGRRKDKKNLAQALSDPYDTLAESLAKGRVINPILHGLRLKTSKRRKYGGGKKKSPKSKKPKNPTTAQTKKARAKCYAAAKERMVKSCRSPRSRYY